MSVHETAVAEAVEPQSFEARSVAWRLDPATTRTALFRLYPGIAVLQHVRTTVVSRGPTPASCTIDTDARPDDLPSDVVDGLRGDGYDVVRGTL